MHKCEIKFTEYLLEQNKNWIYQPPRFKLKKTTYRTDFYCLEDGVYYEVVGSKQAFRSIKSKIIEFIKTYPEINFKIVKPDGSEYVNKEALLKKRESEPKKKFVFYMSDGMREDVLQIAKEKHLSIAEIIRIAIEEHLKRKRKL